MANWYAVLFSRAPSKSVEQYVSLRAIGHPPSPTERQLRTLCICIWEQTTPLFDEIWGHGKISCNSSHCRTKYGVSTLTCPISVSVSGFLKIKPWLHPSVPTRFGCFWHLHTQTSQHPQGLNAREEEKAARVESKICLSYQFQNY